MQQSNIIILLIVLLVVSLIANGVFGYIIITKVSVLQTLKKSILTCIGKPFWTTSLDLIDFPTFIPQQFDASFALFGLILLHNFEISFLDKIPFVYPKQFTSIKEIGKEKIGCILNDSLNDCLWVLFRGTQTKQEIQADIDFEKKNDIHSGFLTMYQKFDLQFTKNKKLVVFGHSLGAALATLTISFTSNPVVGYGFGSPRVGGELFQKKFLPKSKNWFNIMNTDDIVTNLPLAVMPNLKQINNPLIFNHVGEQIFFTSNWGTWLNNHLLPIYADFLESKINKILPATATIELNTKKNTVEEIEL